MSAAVAAQARTDLVQAGGPVPRVRILFVNDTDRNGGPGRSLQVLLRGLPAGRYHRTVLLPRPGEISELLRRTGCADEILFEPDLIENPFAPPRRAMERSDHHAAWPVRLRRLVSNGLRAARGMRRIAALARRLRHDVIYGNGTTANVFAAAASLLAGIPAVWHVRYTRVPALVAPMHHWLAERALVRRIICVSRPAAALFPARASKVAVIPNALELDEWDPRSIRPCLRSELGLPADAVVFGSHGRVLRRKGYLELVGAAARLLQGLGPAERARCHFAVVGDTPADFREDHLATCRARAQELGIADKFTFLGFRADVRPYVADFDVAVVPSIYPDPLPRAVIESMALGKPVVAFAVGGVPEMVHDGVEGTLLGGPPDEAALAEGLSLYLRDPGLAGRQGLLGRRRVQAEFAALTHAHRVEAQIQGALADGGAGATALSEPAGETRWG